MFFNHTSFVTTSILSSFKDTPTTETSTLSLHDALPIYGTERGGDGVGQDRRLVHRHVVRHAGEAEQRADGPGGEDRKSTRLNSSHQITSYAVFCLKKKIIKTSASTLACATSP